MYNNDYICEIRVCFVCLLRFNNVPNCLDDLVFGGMDPRLSLTGIASSYLHSCDWHAWLPCCRCDSCKWYI